MIDVISLIDVIDVIDVIGAIDVIDVIQNLKNSRNISKKSLLYENLKFKKNILSWREKKNRNAILLVFQY